MGDGDQLWSIDPVTFALHPDRPLVVPFTYQQFMAQEWPACPVCARIVQVDPINVQAPGDQFPAYLPGQWRCPIGCVPGDAPPTRLAPAQYAQDLQHIADRRWPHAGVEVTVSVWQRAGPCPTCSKHLERRIGDDGTPGVMTFHRGGELNGRPIRVPHYGVYCESDERA